MPNGHSEDIKWDENRQRATGFGNWEALKGHSAMTLVEQ